VGPGDCYVHQYENALPQAIVVGVPTFGMVSIQWHVSVFGMRAPMNRALAWYHVVGREVGDARNEIVQHALAHVGAGGERASHVFFIDDDTLPPPDALISLLGRKLPIVSALYFAKTAHPQPLMLAEKLGGVIDTWEPGSLVPCYAHGMGCTLIELRVFRDLYAQGRVETAPKSDLNHCNVCGGSGRAKQSPADACGGCFGTGQLIAWFKTTREFRDQNGASVLHYETEDVHFLERAAAAGYQPTVDTAVLAWHWDAGLRKAYPLDGWADKMRTGTPA
jgi:hypothetical protein